MIELSLYRSRIGCFGQNFKKRGLFKPIHHLKYGNLTKKRPFSQEVLQSFFKLALLVSFIFCETVPNKTEVTGPTQSSYNQPTVNQILTAQPSLCFKNILDNSAVLPNLLLVNLFLNHAHFDLATVYIHCTTKWSVRHDLEKAVLIGL